ncbi:efflux RND transporter periplasmic adaptor subunit [Zoogloea sp.]|uniref:efflux RND transporter periplasmic adaptor subunit n=1 Tax=Zoogloea sp. TaxID=49181 RepID=UPI001AC6AD82|nr:efflux RND transporter periplasmic adaptor subunit [Zoogloea sp.]MBN8282854.1 efflux RND transporter periplasmic adaptor subunit [Zoogloea sp.]
MTKARFRLVTLLVSAALVSACSKAPEEAPPAAKPDPALVEPNPELRAQLKVDVIKTAPVVQSLRVAGRISFDEQLLARIGSTVTGRVSSLNAQLGDEVRPGSVLAIINSTELTTAQLAYLKSQTTAELNRKAVERARILLQNDVIGSAELQRRETELALADAERRAAADQLRVLGLSEKTIATLAKSGVISSTTPVSATLHGVVVERKVTPGQVVQPSDALFTVADLSKLWAVAQVPEEQSGMALTGQAVEVEVPALDGQRIMGKVIFVGQTVNPQTRTVLVRVALDNPTGQLKPEMLATMLIDGKPKDMLVVPAGAVVREDNTDYVFLASEDGNRFRQVKVQLGPESRGVRPVLNGLASGAQVVVDGAFHLNNERRRVLLGG